MIAGDAYTITQGSGALSVNTTLADGLRGQPHVSLLSPEILAVGTIRSEPAIVRAAEPYTLARIEGGAVLSGSPVTDRWAFAGEGLSRRLGLAVGGYATLVGSGLPRIEVVRITGIFRTSTPANDELVVDYGVGRSLAGLAATAFHTIRVLTDDPGTLLAYLEDSGASVHVTGPGLARADVNSDPPSEDPLTNVLLRAGRGPLPRDYLSSILAEATNSVRVVAWGLGGLVGLLVALGLHAVQARAFADRRSAVGVLRALGASGTWLRGRILLETLPLAFAAGGLGALLGMLVDSLVRPVASIVLFGHEIPAVAGLDTFGATVAAIVIASMASSLLLLESTLRARPSESLQEAVPREPIPSLEVVLRG